MDRAHHSVVISGKMKAIRTWKGLSIRGFRSAITSPSLTFDNASKAPRLPPLYSFCGLPPSSFLMRSKPSDSNKSKVKNASPLMTALPPVADDFDLEPKSTSLRLTYFLPDDFGVGVSSVGFSFLCHAFLGSLEVELEASSSSRPMPTGARLYLMGPRSATTAMVTQSPSTGTSYPCLSGRRRIEAYRREGDRKYRPRRWSWRSSWGRDRAL